MQTALTAISFLFFTGLVAVLTWWFTRRDDHASSSGYFLAGRSLTFPLIAGSLLLTNLSTEQMVGLNGDAYSYGLSVMVWEVVCVVALVFMAWFFLPRFLRSGVATVPEYLAIRFDQQTQSICNFIFLIAYVGILLPIILYTGATGMMDILDIPKLLGLSSEAGSTSFLTNTYEFAVFSSESPLKINVLLSLIVVVVGVIGSIYALFGGLRTVAVSDTLNGVGLLVGGLLVTFYALVAVAPDETVMGGIEFIRETQGDRLNSVGGNAPNSNVPFGTIFSGIFLLNLFYWTTNQQIIQRTFGASSLAEGQKGVLLTGALKLLGPLYLVLPGIIAYSLFAGEEMKPANAYGSLVNRVLPAHFTGFFAAAMLGAILSSFNSALNSACTLFSLGVYKTMLKPAASDAEVVRSGKIFGWIIAVGSMCIAPLLMGQTSIFGYLQKMNGMYFIPIFAVVLIGMLTRRVSATAAKAGLIIGVIVIPLGYFVSPFSLVVASIGDFHFLGIVFGWLIVFMLVLGEMYPRETEFVQQDVGAVNMEDWPLAKAVGWVLIAIVIAIYATFADFSILAVSS